MQQGDLNTLQQLQQAPLVYCRGDNEQQSSWALTKSPVSRPTEPSVPLPPSKSRTIYTARVYGKVRKTAKANWLNLKQRNKVKTRRRSVFWNCSISSMYSNSVYHIAAIWVLSRDETFSTPSGSRSLVLTLPAIAPLTYPAVLQFLQPMACQGNQSIDAAGPSLRPRIPTPVPALPPPQAGADRSPIT